MSKLDERASEWIDKRLSDPDRDRFLRELDSDPEKAAEAEDLGRVVEALRSLDLERAPADLLADVQRRIRRRSHGRHYAATWRQRLPFEALVTGLLVLVMVAVYLWAGAAQTPALVPVNPQIYKEAFQGGGTGSSLASAILSFYGSIVAEHLSDDGTSVTLTVQVPTSALDGLQREVALYPQLQIVGDPDLAATGEADSLVQVQVRARR